MTAIPPSPFTDSGVPSASPPDEAATSAPSGGVAAEIDEHRFVLDEDKFMFALGCVPDDFAKYMAMMEQLTENDKPPLFLQRTG